MKTTIMVILACLCMSSVSLAKSTHTKSQERKQLINKLVDQYYQAQEAKALVRKNFQPLPPLHPVCNDPSAQGCVDAACSLLSSYECDDLDEVQAVGAACRGNYSGDCLKVACSKVSSYECDDLDEVKQVARACVGNVDGSCVTTVCNRLSSYECDDLDEVIEVAKSCAGS